MTGKSQPIRTIVIVAEAFDLAQGTAHRRAQMEAILRTGRKATMPEEMLAAVRRDRLLVQYPNLQALDEAARGLRWTAPSYGQVWRGAARREPASEPPEAAAP